MRPTSIEEEWGGEGAHFRWAAIARREKWLEGKDSCGDTKESLTGSGRTSNVTAAQWRIL